MSDELKPGDRVSWLHKPMRGKEPPRTMTGTVVRCGHFLRKPCAFVESDGEGKWGSSWVVPLADLTRLTDTALVAAAAALPVDDQSREDAISDLRVITTDYELALEHGDYGGEGVMTDEEMEFDLVCFAEAWEYLNDNYPALATSVQKMVRKGMTPENIKRRAIINFGVHREPLALRCENAAKYLESNK